MKFSKKFAAFVLASVLGVSCFPDKAKAVSFSFVDAVARRPEQLDLFVVGRHQPNLFFRAKAQLRTMSLVIP